MRVTMEKGPSAVFGCGHAPCVAVKTPTSLLRTAGYSGHGPGMGSPSLTPLCIPSHQPHVFTAPACSPRRGPTGHPPGTCPAQPREPSRPRHEAGSHHRDPLHHREWDLLSYPHIRSMSGCFSKHEGVASAVGAFRGLGSLSLPAPIAGRSHHTCVCWV